MTEEKENCIFQQNYSVFGLEDKPCCYLYHKYCDEIDNCYFKRCKRLEQELKWANDEEKYLKDCCIKAGKELEKHSFKWDGKEKNLIVQALQLNQLYEKLEQENKEQKKDVQLFKCLDTFGENECHCACRCLGNEFCEDADKKINTYRSALEEINKIAEPRFVNGLNEEADLCNLAMDRIQSKISEVLGCK